MNLTNYQILSLNLFYEFQHTCISGPNIEFWIIIGFHRFYAAITEFDGQYFNFIVYHGITNINNWKLQTDYQGKYKKRVSMKVCLK